MEYRDICSELYSPLVTVGLRCFCSLSQHRLVSNSARNSVQHPPPHFTLTLPHVAIGRYPGYPWLPLAMRRGNPPMAWGKSGRPGYVAEQCE